mgnify:CR=1 FL=1
MQRSCQALKLRPGAMTKASQKLSRRWASTPRSSERKLRRYMGASETTFSIGGAGLYSVKVIVTCSYPGRSASRVPATVLFAPMLVRTVLLCDEPRYRCAVLSLTCLLVLSGYYCVLADTGY